YLIFPEKKIYAENPGAQAAGTDDWADFLTTEWLNQKTEASFEKLKTTENLTQYRVNLGDSNSSEIFVYVDEASGLPVKQEFYAISGEQKTLTYSFELKNLKLETDENLFSIPTDFKKISIEEFRKILRSGED